jgi:hypothetical protein
MLREDPNREYERRLNVLPRLPKLSRLNCDPSWSFEMIESCFPPMLEARIERVLPRFTKFSTDSSESRLPEVCCFPKRT